MEGIKVRISNLMLGASISALVLAGLGVAQPAWAQAGDTPVSAGDAKVKETKKKAKAATVAAGSGQVSAGSNQDNTYDPEAIVITARRQALQTATELKRLRPARIVVLGGAGVVSSGVQTALNAYATG